MIYGMPSKLQMTPNAEKTEFQFRLWFPEQQRPVEFSMSADGTMLMMHALQYLQAKHKIPIPDSARPHGKPVLRIVTDEDE